MANVTTIKLSTDFDEFLKWCDETISVLERLKLLLRNIPDLKIRAAAEGDETQPSTTISES